MMALYNRVVYSMSDVTRNELNGEPSGAGCSMKHSQQGVKETVPFVQCQKGEEKWHYLVVIIHRAWAAVALRRINNPSVSRLCSLSTTNLTGKEHNKSDLQVYNNPS